MTDRPTADLRPTRLRLVHSRPAPSRDWSFTAKDLVQISEWMAHDQEHGYLRSPIAGGDGSTAEDGAYILLYAPGRDWAVWGLAPAGDSITIWHCGSGIDLAHFPTMLEALESLPNARLLTPRRSLRRPRRSAPGPNLSRTRENTREPRLAFV